MSLKNKSDNPIPLEKKRKLLYYSFTEIPFHLQDNKYIHSRYRANYSLSDCAKSLFKLHNETFNIWTHFFGAAFFLGTLIYNFNTEFRATDKLVLLMYLIACVVCMLLSSVFHTFLCHKKIEVFVTCAVCDYLGISVLICASYFSLLYFLLYNNETLQKIYTGTTLVLCGVAMVLTIFPFFRHPEYANLRATFFVSLGSILTVFITHSLYVIQIHNHYDTISPSYTILELSCYLVGAFVYAIKFPESKSPGNFDLYLSSHQIWHLAVLVAAYCHWIVLKNLAQKFINH